MDTLPFPSPICDPGVHLTQSWLSEHISSLNGTGFYQLCQLWVINGTFDAPTFHCYILVHALILNMGPHFFWLPSISAIKVQSVLCSKARILPGQEHKTTKVAIRQIFCMDSLSSTLSFLHFADRYTLLEWTTAVYLFKHLHPLSSFTVDPAYAPPLKGVYFIFHDQCINTLATWLLEWFWPEYSVS